MSLRFLIILACITTAANAQTTTPKVGEHAPPLSLETILLPEKTPPPTWETLKGKAVVLEFWATWCAPCVEQIPHLNELAGKLAGQPIQFISITDETPELIDNFLKKRPISGMVALNPSKSQSKAYGVVGIPYTVLVDANGIIAGITSPQQLTEAVLGDLMAGKPLNVTNPMQFIMASLREDLRGAADSSPALLDILIRPSTSGKSSSVMSGMNTMKLTGTTLRYALTNAYGMAPSRIVAGSWADEPRYDIQVTVPRESQSYFNPMVQQALETAFQIKAHRETQERDVLILTAPHGRPVAFRDGAGMGSMFGPKDGKFVGMNVMVGSLASLLESVSKQMVVDETGLRGQYDFELQCDFMNPESVKTAIIEQLGFEVTSGKRPVEVLVVEKTSASSY